MSYSKELKLVGVGPGDPSLLTIAALRAIQSANILAYPVHKEGAESMAINIVSDFIRKDQNLLPLLFPMVTSPEVLKDAWKKAGDQINDCLKKEQRVVFLTQGDVSFFSTSSYLLLDLKTRFPHIDIRLVPGITSLSAAAAIGKLPLILQKEQLLVMPTPSTPLELEETLLEAARQKRVLALLKLGSRWLWVKPLLEKLNLLEGSIFAQRVGWPDQEVMPANAIPANLRPYFSLLVIRQSWPDIMP